MVGSEVMSIERHVRFGSEANIASNLDVRFTPKADMRAPFFAFDLGQSAFEFVGPKYSKR
jgi:hypothetical protein